MIAYNLIITIFAGEELTVPKLFFDQKTTLVIAKLIFLFSFAPLSFSDVKADIQSRIAPVGSLCMEGDPCAAQVIQVASGPRTGEEIYQSKCLACHLTGAAGAPKLGDVDQWAPRINKGLDVLYLNAINGIGGMPAKGLCMDCSDEEIQGTVDYMVSQSQ